MDLIADTTFLVGLWRRQDWAVSYAGRHSSFSMGIPWIVLGEFWHGANRANHDPEEVRRFLQLGVPLCDPAPVIPYYAEICSELQSKNVYRAVGQNDLWIAAVARAYDKPLITRNQRHFDSVSGLEIEVIGH